MRTTHRPYSEEQGDFRRIADFLIEQHDYLRTHSTWSLARFVDWKYGLYPNRTAVPDFCGQNAELWWDGFGRLAALAICEKGDSGFAIITAPGYRLLFAEVLAWGLANWATRPGTPTVELTERQDWEISILQRNGFRSDLVFYSRYFDLTQELTADYSLEEGFTIIDMATCPEYVRQRLMRAEAFDGKATLSAEELQHQLEFYNHTHQSPIYHPDTDLCVKAPEGHHVAGCEALIDAWNCSADIERVCTHSKYRRRGLARAVIMECLCRLKAMGIRRAYITGYSAEAISLYGSLGAVDELQCFVYKKED